MYLNNSLNTGFNIMIFRVKKYCIILLLNFFNSAYVYTYIDTFKDIKLTLIKKVETRNSYISFVTDTNNNRYLIKQKKYSDIIRVARHVLCEFLSTYIAQKAKINSQKVWVLASSLYNQYKSIPHFPASLHSFVDGLHISNKRYPYDKAINIRQAYSKHAPVDTGLTLEVVRCMVRHSDLAKIVALDTFTGNGDRTIRNILYVINTNNYFVIDMDPTFRKNLAAVACKNIKKWIRDTTVVFTKEEICALTIYKKTLQKIMRIFTVNELCNICDTVVDELRVKSHYKFVDIIKDTIIESYASTQKLITFLDRLIETKSKNYKSRKIKSNRIA